MRVSACVSVVFVGLCGCNDVGRAVPEDRAVFPTGLAVDKDGSHLVVVSSDFDFAFDTGAVLVADLNDVRAKLGQADDVVDDPWVSSIKIPPLGDRPVITDDGTVFVVTRGGNLLHELQLDGGDLVCGDGDACTLPPHVLQLGANDPDRTILFPNDDETDLRKRGLITHLSAGQAEIFNFNPAVDDATRLTVERDVVFFGDDVVGVKSAGLRVVDGDDDQVFVTLQKTLDGSSQTSFTDLGVFAVPAPGRADDVEVTTIDMTAATGSLFARSFALVGAENGVAVVVALRGPDAVARFFFDDRTGAFSLTNVSESCLEPTEVVPAPSGRVLVTCQGGEVVQALDAVTLDVQDSVRFYGKNPFGLAVDAAHNEAYVSFFLDDSVGVLGLLGADGSPKLVPHGHLGTPLPPPEDGRE